VIVPDCGESMYVSFALYDRDTSSWKTSQRCLFGGWTEFSETWPRFGTMRNGECFQVSSLERPKYESEFSLWPTPSKSDGERFTKFSRVSLINQYHSEHTLNCAEALAGEFGLSHTPMFSEWLMMLPIGHTALDAAETPSSPTKANGLDAES